MKVQVGPEKGVTHGRVRVPRRDLVQPSKVRVPGFPGRLATLYQEWRSRNLFVATPTGYWLIDEACPPVSYPKSSLRMDVYA